MTSRQAAKWLLCKGFVAEELYIQNHRDYLKKIAALSAELESERDGRRVALEGIQRVATELGAAQAKRDRLAGQVETLRVAAGALFSEFDGICPENCGLKEWRVLETALAALSPQSEKGERDDSIP